MLLRFNVTMEDLVAFNRHYFARTSFLLALKIVVMAVGSLVIVGRALSHITDTSDPTRIAVGLGIGWGVGFTMAAVYCVIIHYLFRWLADSTVRFMYRAGKNKGVLGLHEIEIDPQGLTERTDVNDSKYTWHGVETIAETDDYLFIYITTMTAHIIPKHRAFMATCQPLPPAPKSTGWRLIPPTRLNGQPLSAESSRNRTYCKSSRHSRK